MADREESDAMLADHPTSATGNAGFAWFKWMFLFGVLGISTTIGVKQWVENWCADDESRQSHAWMLEQMEQLRRGEINCFVSPDPRFVGELLADAACAAKVQDLYLGGDLSDARLERLRELPKLKCIAFLFADHHSAFLQHMCGMTTIEELSFERTRLGRGDVDCIASFPQLKSLHLSYVPQSSDLEGLRGHPSLERLSLDTSASDKAMIPLFQSMSHLRDLTVAASHAEEASQAGDSFEKLLVEGLPGCKCRVSQDDR